MSQPHSKLRSILVAAVATIGASFAFASTPSIASETLDVSYLAPLHARLQHVGILDACDEKEPYEALIEEGMVRRAIFAHHSENALGKEEAVLRDSLFGSGFSTGVKTAVLSIRKWDTEEEFYPSVCNQAVERYNKHRQALEGGLPTAPAGPKRVSAQERRALTALIRDASTPLVRASLLQFCDEEQAEKAEVLDAEIAALIAESKPEAVLHADWSGRATHFLAGYSAGKSYQFHQSMGEAACDMARE